MYHFSNIFYSFFVGICIGSFLNVVIYRFPKELSIIKPRSFCPSCKTKLTWRENIPLISWLTQRAKCINCGTSISIRYPLIEFLTGILFIIFINSSSSFYSFDSSLIFKQILSWIFLSLLICISLIDIDSLWIPQGLINFGFFSGILGLVFVDLFSNTNIGSYLVFKGITTSVVSFFICESLRYLAKNIFNKDALGKGDSKLVAMIGIWLGPLGTLFAVAISYILAAIFCIIGLSMKFLKLRQVIPFAPFLSIGALMVWLFGNDFFIEKILRI